MQKPCHFERGYAESRNLRIYYYICSKIGAKILLFASSLRMTTTFEDFALCVLIKTDNHNCSLNVRFCKSRRGDPVAVPAICSRRRSVSASGDRCHSLTSLHPPQAALGSLPLAVARRYNSPFLPECRRIRYVSLHGRPRGSPLRSTVRIGKSNFRQPLKTPF